MWKVWSKAGRRYVCTACTRFRCREADASTDVLNIGRASRKAALPGWRCIEPTCWLHCIGASAVGTGRTWQASREALSAAKRRHVANRCCDVGWTGGTRCESWAYRAASGKTCIGDAHVFPLPIAILQGRRRIPFLFLKGRVSGVLG